MKEKIFSVKVKAIDSYELSLLFSIPVFLSVYVNPLKSDSMIQSMFLDCFISTVTNGSSYSYEYVLFKLVHYKQKKSRKKNRKDVCLILIIIDSLIEVWKDLINFCTE